MTSTAARSIKADTANPLIDPSASACCCSVRARIRPPPHNQAIQPDHNLGFRQWSAVAGPALRNPYKDRYPALLSSHTHHSATSAQLMLAGARHNVLNGRRLHGASAPKTADSR